MWDADAEGAAQRLTSRNTTLLTRAASQPARAGQQARRSQQANMRQIVVILNGPALDAASGPSQ